MNDLDLSKIPDSDHDKLASSIESFFKKDTTQKAYLSYSWELNHLMLDGQQWLVYDGAIENGGAWRRLVPMAANEYIPRPVTNYIFDAFQTLKGYLLKNKPRSSVRPNTQTHRDKTAAKIAELIVETNYERLKEAYNYEYAAACLVTYGTVFKKDYWDSSYLNTVKVPIMEQKPVIDPASGQPTGQMEQVQSLDEAGYPAFETLPLGDVFTTIIEPYKLSLDPVASNIHDARWIMETSIRPLNWIVENYDKTDEGYTGKAQEVKEEKALPNSMRRFFQLRTSSGVRATQNGFTATSQYNSSDMIENAAIVKEYWEAPSEGHPKGRLIVVANNVVLYVGESPCEGPEQGDWHPYSECRWEIVPGRFWGKSPLDAAVEIQRQINSIDSIIILTRKTMAVPQKLVPQGSVPPGKWTGQPGQQIDYRPGPNGEKPENIAPIGVDQSVWQERSQRVEDIKQVSGAIDILKGDRPPGVTAASALALLYEVGTGKLFPILDRWKNFIESSQKKQLRLISKKYKEPRPEFIAQLVSKNKDLTEDQVRNFVGEDLYDNCNVIIDAVSSIPKLKAAEQAYLLELAQIGVLNLDNPANRQEFLSKFGIHGFDEDYSKDVQRAEWENDLLDDLVHNPQNKAIVLDCDNHDIHISIHENRIKEPSFMSLPFEIQQAFFAHNKEHEDIKAQKEQMAQMQQAAMGMPPQQGAPNPMEAQEKIKKGKGVGEKTKQLLMPDLFGPGNLVNK